MLNFIGFCKIGVVNMLLMINCVLWWWVNFVIVCRFMIFKVGLDGVFRNNIFVFGCIVCFYVDKFWLFIKVDLILKWGSNVLIIKW